MIAYKPFGRVLVTVFSVARLDLDTGNQVACLAGMRCVSTAPGMAAAIEEFAALS
jgi:hypothetical protein